MTTFTTTLILFAIAWVLHFVWWRVLLPQYHTRALLGIFFLVLGAWLASGPWRHLAWPAVLHVALFYTAASLCYIITYSAIEGDSPTLSLIRQLDSGGGTGMSEAEVERFLTDRPFVKARLRALIHDGLIEERSGRFIVKSGGSLFFRVILGFRKLYGPIERGG